MSKSRKAMVFGSTGLIGSELVRLLMKNEHYSDVITISRGDTQLEHWDVSTEIERRFFEEKWRHVKLPHVDVPFDQKVPLAFTNETILQCGEFWVESLQQLPWDDVTDVFISIGTTRRKAGSEIGFWHIDVDLKAAIARVAKQKNVQRLLCVSSIGASANAPNFYLRAKGTMEQAIITSELPQIHFMRPSLLLGNRKEHRPGERFAIWFSTTFPWIYSGPFAKYRPISAKLVATRMVEIATNWPQPPMPEGYDQHPSAVFFHESSAMQKENRYAPN